MTTEHTSARSPTTSRTILPHGTRAPGTTVLEDLSGFEPTEVDVTIDNECIVIQARHTTRTESHEYGYSLRERTDTVHRRIPLPTHSDASAAHVEFDRGLLTITVPLHKVEQHPRVHRQDAEAGE